MATVEMKHEAPQAFTDLPHADTFLVRSDCFELAIHDLGIKVGTPDLLNTFLVQVFRGWLC